MEAVARIKQALADQGKPMDAAALAAAEVVVQREDANGDPVKVRRRAMVEVSPEDIAAVCQPLAADDKIAAALFKGSTRVLVDAERAEQERPPMVAVQVSDVLHVLALVG